MPSPSVALLAALVTGKGRPKRLLVQENAPAFVSNLGLIVGATVAKVPPQDIDEVLAGLLRGEGLRAEQVWAVATHRNGTLSPTDWLSRCVANGIPCVELCLGSLYALVRWSPFPATFTIVDLDAEEAFAGARLAALLTNDPALAARVRELCLPAAGAQEYIFDALPRSLGHDEPALESLVERVVALDGEKPPATLRFEPAASLEDQKKIDELQRTVDRWESLFEEAEIEAAKDAEILSRARADLLKQKSEFESALAAAHAEKEALARTLARAERERDLAVADASRHDESERGALGALKERVAELEKAVAASADREAKLSAAAAAADQARAGLLQQKTAAEQALASLQAERKVLEGKLLDLEAQLAEARKEAETRAGEHRIALEEQGQRAARLEKDVATLAAREAARLREWAGSRDDLSTRLAAMETERGALATRLEAAEKDRDRAVSEAARREEALKGEASEQRRRADRLEAEASALKEREAKLTEGFSASRAGLAEEMSRLESEAVLARKATAALQAERAADAQALAEARAEIKALSGKLAEADQGREKSEKAGESEAAKARAFEGERAQMSEKIAGLEASLAEARKAQAALEAEKARAARLEKDLAAGVEREARLTDEGTRLKADLSGRIVELEASLAAAEKARTDLVAQLAAMETDHAAALRNVAQGDEALRQALDAEKRRAVQLAGDVSNLRERDARLNQEWEASRTEWTERLRRAEEAALVARNANAGLVARKNEADQARASLQAELEEQMRLAQALKMEAAATAAREAKKVEAAEAARAELEARITRLEAAEAIADKARTELLNRKRETEKALAEAQAERAALVKKLAIAENERDQARAAAGRPGTDPKGQPSAPVARPAAPPGGRNTGGLSALVGLWNTALTRRPAPIAEPQGPVTDLKTGDILPVEALLGDPPPSSPAPPAAAAAAAPAAPVNHRTTGGLSALVNLWNTAATMRPFRRKEAEAKDSEAGDPVMGIEEIAEEAPTPGAPASGPGAPPRPRPGSTTPGPRAKPNPAPRKPETKPAPPPDEAEKLGGWLRGLAGKVRGKPK